MSRIGKKPIPVPAGVKVEIKDRKVKVQGPMGTLEMNCRPEIKVVWTESEKAVNCTIEKSAEGDPMASAYWGTTRAILRNMIDGVAKGYEESMEVVGVGWTAAVTGKNLKLVVGFANPINMPIPMGLTVAVDKQIVKVSGADKQQVGHFAASMRKVRKPEPYNGKGIKYVGEVIKKKQGKKFGA